MLNNVVTTDLLLGLVVPGESTLPVAARVSYDAADPYAVTVCFQLGQSADEDIVWTFARQLLTDGVSRPAGEGDVQVWPAAGGVDGAARVCLRMSSPHGEASFEGAMVDVVSFLASTYVIVPTGEESSRLDVDAALARLLDGR